MNVEQIRISNDPMALARALNTARSVMARKKPEEEGYQKAYAQIQAIEERFIDMRRRLSEESNGLGSIQSPDTLGELFGKKAEVRILEHQISQLKKENERLEKYRDERDSLQDKVRELERDKRDLEYEANKRSTIQEIGELLKDKEIREMGLGLLAGNGSPKALNGFQSEAKNRLQGWLQECSEDEAQGILNVLILAGDQYSDSASFNEEIGGVIQKHISQYQENQPTH